LAVDSYVRDPSPNNPYTVHRYGHPISAWDVSEVDNFYDVFSSYRNPAMATFNEPLDGWDVSGAKDLSFMFSGATAFNQKLSSWDVSKATDM